VKKNYLLFLLLIFIFFSCKGTPENNKGAGVSGLSKPEVTAKKDKVDTELGSESQTDENTLAQDDITAEEDKLGAEFDNESQTDDNTLAQDDITAEEDKTSEEFGDESQTDENTLAQDDITDGSETAENQETENDDLQAEAAVEEKPLVVEAVDEKKETPLSEEKKTPSPAAVSVQPPPAVTKEEQPSAEAPAVEEPAQEKQDAAQSENDVEQPPPPRYQPWIAPPPAVTAVRDDATVPNRRGLVQPKEEIVFSRTVNAAVGQLVEIPFRGNNWSYLEDLASRRGIVYNSRRNDPEGTSFIFRAEEAGTYTLKFYRQDFIRDYILNDYVQVIVSESPNKGGGAAGFNPPIDRGKVTAEPRWPSALEEAAMLRGGQGGAKTASGASTTAPENKSGSLPSEKTTSANGVGGSASVQARETGTQPQSVQQPQVVKNPSAAGASSANASNQAATAPAVIPAERTPQSASSGATPQASVTATIPQASTPQVSASETPQAAAGTPDGDKQEKIPPDEIIKKAQDAFNGGDAAAAIALLDQYMEFYPDGSDEVYWMYGQFYEANTPSRNILLSLDYYRRLVNEYPQSKRYNDARRRIAYLERFYINIQ